MMSDSRMLDEVSTSFLDVLGSEGATLEQVCDVLDVPEGPALRRLRLLINEGLVFEVMGEPKIYCAAEE